MILERTAKGECVNAREDKFTYAHGTLAKGEAGRTGDWRQERPEIDHSRCTPAKNKRPSCFLCWLYCPEGVVKRSIPVEIDLEYCKGCGICAEECPTKAIKMLEDEKG
ncbi:MAG TPA: pyruvate ferredoxin oxidoreductase [Syntrophobacteraceae bacterium]|nr:pyruvate ferredoxin oxidoreductase [Syntrophobacteraceae bacterium]HBZ56779.1 pyruvate ferredoxin oxidoreductase [Syntrophobacteraceae bacterium]